MTATEIDFLPREWWTALEKEPSCLVLRRALADALEEKGDLEAADCIRWTVEKGRTPREGSWCAKDPLGSGQEALPHSLWEAGNRVINDVLYLMDTTCQVRAFRRLVWRWGYTTPEQRAEFWKWNPYNRVDFNNRKGD